MNTPRYPTPGSHPTIEEVRDYYLRPDILAEIFLATQVRDVTFIYCEPGGQDVRVELHLEDVAELDSFFRQFFARHEGCLEPYPWLTIGVDSYSNATAYSPDRRQPIGWDAVIEFDYGWRRSFGELYSGMQVLDDFGIYYRTKFSGHHSLHFVLPAEALPVSFCESPDEERWRDGINKLGAFVAERSHYLRHGWMWSEEDEEMYSAPYSVHRAFGLAAVPLLPGDLRAFRPWMASVHLAAPVEGWWQVPNSAADNFRILLDRIDSGRRFFDVGKSPETESAERRGSGYVASALERARSLAGPTDSRIDGCDIDVRGRRQKVWAAMILGTEVHEELLRAADDEDNVVRWFAFEALAANADPGVDRARLASVAEGGISAIDEYVSQAALDLLCRAGKPGIAHILGLIGTHPAALWTLENWVETEGEAAVEEFVYHIQNSDSQLRGAALLVLGKVARFAAPRLAELMCSPEEDIRLRALGALLEIGQGATPFLQETLQSGREPACTLSRHALQALERDSADRQPAVPLPQIARMTAMEENLAMPMLCHQLELPDKKIRYMAIKALSHFGRAAVPTWIDLLGNRSVEIRRRACEALRDMAPEQARAALQKGLLDEDTKVRQNAVRALARIGHADDLRLLPSLLSDASRAVRRTVRETLEA